MIHNDHVATVVTVQPRDFHFRLVRMKCRLDSGPLTEGIVDGVGVFRLIENRGDTGQIMLDRIRTDKSPAGPNRVGNQSRMTILIDSNYFPR